ncbi:MAG: 50S ribosomal protein L31 [Candidatus Buchananbacteria bacterium]
MKKDTHPQYHPKAKVICACGNSFTVGSTLPEVHVEICSMCHPFFTGKQKLLDSARRVEKFKDRLSKQQAAASTRKGKKVKRATADSKKKAAKKSTKE